MDEEFEKKQTQLLKRQIPFLPGNKVSFKLLPEMVGLVLGVMVRSVGATYEIRWSSGAVDMYDEMELELTTL